MMEQVLGCPRARLTRSCRADVYVSTETLHRSAKAIIKSTYLVQIDEIVCGKATFGISF